MVRRRSYGWYKNGCQRWSCRHFHGTKKAAHSLPQLPFRGRQRKFSIAKSSATHASGALSWCGAVHMDGTRTVGIDGAAGISMAQKYDAHSRPQLPLWGHKHKFSITESGTVLSMSKNDDELNKFIDEVTDGAYNLPSVEVIFNLVKQMQPWGDERIKKIVAVLTVEGIKICITTDIWYSISYVCAPRNDIKLDMLI
jgi:hypothetical protein